MSKISSETAANLLIVAFWLVVLFVIISEVAYAFRHPELTDTQRLLNFVDVLFWR
jgi:hypothetical protein